MNDIILNARLRTINPDNIEIVQAGPLTDIVIMVDEWPAVQLTTNDLTPGRVMVKRDGIEDPIHTTEAKAVDLIMEWLGWANDGVEMAQF